MIDSGREYYSLYTIDRHFSFGYSRPLNRYEIRKDGFACVMAGGDERVVTTKPIIFDGGTLHLNFETSAYGYIYVSVLDENGNVISGGESVEVFGNTIDRRVVFGENFDLGSLAGKPVTLRFRMRDAKSKIKALVRGLCFIPVFLLLLLLLLLFPGCFCIHASVGGNGAGTARTKGVSARTIRRSVYTSRGRISFP